MAKYSTEFKIKVVKEYLESNISYKNLSDKYNIPTSSIIKNWVNAYKSQGFEGLKVKRRNTQYTLEYKLNVVNLSLPGEMSYQSLANELKINNRSIIRWVKDFREKGIEGLEPKKRERPSKMPKTPKKSKDIKIDSSENLTNPENNSLTEAQLEEKNYWLQLENDAIKKDRIVSNDRCRNKTIAETIRVLRNKYKLKDLLIYFNLPKSTYMYWQKRLNMPNKDEEITNKTKEERIFYSDQGWAYQVKQYTSKLESNGIDQSMPRKGNCLDNSPMENFFGILKQEIYYGNKFYSYEHLKKTIENFIKYYNEERIKEKLGYLSPVEYRKKNAT